MSKIIFAIYDIPVSDVVLGTSDLIEEFGDLLGHGPGPTYCNGSYSQITQLGGGLELLNGCVIADGNGGQTENIDSIEFIVGAHYDLITEGTAPIFLTLFDDGGLLTFPFDFPPHLRDNSVIEACMDRSVVPVSCEFNITVGIDSGTFGYLEIIETLPRVPEPASITIVAAALLALAALRFRKPWRKTAPV
jgi:hypothetical protein